ncbi:MAG: peptidoglycan DD-metalloendopeptidase family protein [Planctomycetota bacterium]|jgi:murein DD-endopeptidase MepM/ murein hydrolase activator NlpD
MMLATPSHADTVFGPETFQRGKGKPVTITTSFSVANAVTDPSLRIQVGQIASAVITLNGTQIFGPSDFNQTVTLLETPVTLLSDNELGVELRGKPGGSITVEITGDSVGPPQVVATIPPEGGQISLPGFGTVIFPSGAFETSQEVELTVTSDPQIAAEFDSNAFLFSPAARTSYELRVKTGFVELATDVEVKLEVPPELEAQLPPDHEFGIYTLIHQESADEVLDNFEILSTSFSQFLSTSFSQVAEGDSLVVGFLPPGSFWNARNTQGIFEAVIIIGTMPIQPVVDTSALADKFGVIAGQQNCLSREDPHKVLGPPLDGSLTVTSPYDLERESPISKKIVPHRGTDYATRDETGQPVEGLDVRALDDGVITKVDVNEKEVLALDANGQPIPDPNNPGQFLMRTVGWGQLVAIRHPDGSQSLYAHLQKASAKKLANAKVVKDEIIATSGQTGGATGPHLHVELMPFGKPLISTKGARPFKVDPARCISRKLYVANPGSFSSSPGVIRVYDTTQAFSLVTRPSGLSELQTTAVAAFNMVRYVTGGTAATLNGDTFSTFAGRASGIGTNRLGVYVSENFLDLGGGFNTDAIIYRFDHDGSSQTELIRILGEASCRILAVNDKRIVDTDFSSVRIFDVSGSGPIAIVSPDLIFFAGAATQDRIYLADHVSTSTGLAAVIKIFDNNGGFQATLPLPIQGRVFGLAASEKRLYVAASDQRQILIFERTVMRDDTGQIVSDQYSLFPIGALPEPGLPLGLALE